MYILRTKVEYWKVFYIVLYTDVNASLGIFWYSSISAQTVLTLLEYAVPGVGNQKIYLEPL